jgi:hypothetical protein
MGESEVCFFAESIEVTDASCRITEDTIDRLVQMESAASFVHGMAAKQQLAASGINKQQVLLAFGHLVSIDLKKRLSDAEGLYGDDGARVYAGTPGGRHKSLWNPVILAVGLRERNNAAKHLLNRAFQEHSFLNPWWEEWKEVYDGMP